MRKLVWTVGATLGGGVGWWAGAHVGFMTAWMVSTLGTALGVYFARRLLDDYLA